MPLTATTLTLPYHKVEVLRLAAHAGLCTLFENPCRELTVTPEVSIKVSRLIFQQLVHQLGTAMYIELIVDSAVVSDHSIDGHIHSMRDIGI
jgi:hypothetical protein